MKTDNITEISSSVRLMTIKEVAKFFNLSDYAIRNGVKNGEIPHVRLGGKYYISVDDFLKKIK